MKRQLLSLFVILWGYSAWSQSILVVADNNYFPANNDTIFNDISHTSYTLVEMYNIDTEGSNPDITVLENYDLVIWYCSSDGANLHLWDEGTNGLLALNTYLYGEGKLWVIGTDVLYSGGYSTPTTFTSGSFAYDKMGLLSYDAQSYADDGSTGVAELDVASGAPGNFTDPISWIYPTSWYVDAVTPNTGIVNIYEMGPASYALAGKSVMIRNLDAASNLTSSFFDPYEINTFDNRVAFFQATMDYILNGGLGIKEEKSEVLSVYPNPVEDLLTIQLNAENAATDYEVLNSAGQTILSGNGTSVDVKDLATGIYLLKINGSMTSFVKK